MENETPEVVTPEVVESKEAKQDPMIPKTRFDEINAKYKEMADKVAEYERIQAEIQAEAERKELEAKKEQGKFEELYMNTQKELETYKTYESRAKELESVITNMVEAKLQAIPEDMHDLIPSNLTAEQTLNWITKAESKGIFGKPELKEIGRASNVTTDSPKVDKANLSALDKILMGLGR